MPELPEVETVRRTVADRAVGKRVASVTVHRRDVVVGDASPAALGAGATLQRIDRHGKQLALIVAGRCVCVHLGMSGSLRLLRGDQPDPIHTHITWRLPGDQRMVFADPRRFGGVWTFDGETALRSSRWSKLGPDALTIQPAALHCNLQRTRRAIKAALLDQTVVAGLGNIYVDELLFRCRVHPLTPAGRLDGGDVRRLVRAMRRLLSGAIAAGGTTLRDYVDGSGQAGGYQTRRQVHGRTGQPCRRCGRPLDGLQVGGRTTVCCPACQPLLIDI